MLLVWGMVSLFAVGLFGLWNAARKERAASGAAHERAGQIIGALHSEVAEERRRVEGALARAFRVHAKHRLILAFPEFADAFSDASIDGVLRDLFDLMMVATGTDNIFDAIQRGGSITPQKLEELNHQAMVASVNCFPNPFKEHVSNDEAAAERFSEEIMQAFDAAVADANRLT